MPKLTAAQIGNLLPSAMRFAMPEGVGERAKVSRLTDGSVIMEAVPLVANQDMIYLAYELPTEELFNLEVWWEDTPAPEGFVSYNQKFTGRLTHECAEMTLDQFEGLALVDGHMDVEIGKRDEVAVGTFLRQGILDGDLVRTRALVSNATAILKVETEGSELSIGGMAYMSANEKRGADGEPDFFIHRINLNHVALVKYGRAGPEARLLNHRAELAHKKKEIPTMKVSINGVEIEVADVVVNHFSTQITSLETQVSTLTTAATALNNSVTLLTTERDVAQGALTAAEAELTNAQEQAVALANAAPDVAVEATRIANEHAAFTTEASRLGHTDELTLGGYARNEVMLTVLNARGSKLDDKASTDTLKGAWDFALLHAEAGGRSVLDNVTNVTATPLVNISEGAVTAVKNSYFGGAVKKEV